MTEPSPARVAVLARAKVNLYLHVLGRRADGYHLLDSLVVFADVGDRIEAAGADSLRLAVDGPFAGEVPAGDDNLVLQAARALADAAGRPARAAIRLTKSLPVASGIGGGSADAAATLRALVRLWRVDIDGERLRRLALALGADVPMCLGARPVFVGGIGAWIDPALDLPACALLLVNPRAALPTPQVFARRRGPFSPPGRFTTPPADAHALAAQLADRRNDLTEAAIGLVPAIAAVLDALRATPGVLLARMSGSGATCFGLCEDEAAASAAARALSERHPEWWIAAASVAGRNVSD
jgi:4-diphosphocytidyl-2-C-methyl-D-erythritol kinase